MSTPLEGYPKLAALQGLHPEVGIYRRFSEANARNLLYLQAEIVDLEDMLKHYTLADLVADDKDRNLYSRNWFKLSQKRNGIHNSQWHTMLQLRAKLNEYNTCLIQQKQLADFDAPEKGNLLFLQRWLVELGQGNSSLEGLDRNTWKDGKDLLIIRKELLDDNFTRVICTPFIDVYHRFWSKKFSKPTDLEYNLTDYSDRAVLHVADIIGTMLSSLLPIMAVVVLYVVKDMKKRLGLVALFTMLFSGALLVTTKARRIEIFSATAAFAAVLVVYIGSTSEKS